MNVLRSDFDEKTLEHLEKTVEGWDGLNVGCAVL